MASTQAGRPASSRPAPDRVAARRPSSRRPIPPLIFLLVLALIALAVWWKVFGDAATQEQATDQACASASAAPPDLDPTTLRLRVLNASGIDGQASLVAVDLRARSFTVEEISNDSSERQVTGVGEIRHGRAGTDAAKYLAAYLPGALDVVDNRAAPTVDIVIGPDFAGLATADQVAAVLSPASSAAAACSSGSLGGA